MSCILKDSPPSRGIVGRFLRPIPVGRIACRSADYLGRSGKIMLDEIDADFAGPRTSAQAADRQGGIWQQRLVARLDDRAVEELKPATTSFEVVQVKLFFSHRSRERRRNAECFEIERGRIAGRVGLMIVEERAGLVLLESENPVRH